MDILIYNLVVDALDKTSLQSQPARIKIQAESYSKTKQLEPTKSPTSDPNCGLVWCDMKQTFFI